MALSNTQTRYGSVAKTLHWLTALLILCLIPLGILASDAPFDTAEGLARKAWLFSLHKTLGVTLFFVAVLRILWAVTQPKPAPLHPERRGETLLAETVHWLLYGSLILVPVSGWVHHAATEGFAPIWWPLGQSLPFVPKSEAVAGVSAALHVIFERVLLVSILLHIAGALKHHFVDRDDTLRRMLPGRTEAGTGHGKPARGLSVTVAVAAWAAALGIGAGLGLFQTDREASAAVAPQLEEVASDWMVQSGSLGIAVTQLGNRVEGAFADWTAAIRFDEAVRTGPAGDVRVEVSIPSLTLGSVTQQALGPDFLAAQEHPVAVFEAEILRTETGDEARGTLTIRDRSVPLTLPFTLVVEDGLARMTGSAVVDRLDFGVGETQDAKNLGLDVEIVVSLETRRAE